MDNDLMARRLRPPSEPPKPQNGNSSFGSGQSPWTTDSEVRADVPWDRPADEAWPPIDELVAERAWPPMPARPEPMSSAGEHANFEDPMTFDGPANMGIGSTFEPEPAMFEQEPPTTFEQEPSATVEQEPPMFEHEPATFQQEPAPPQAAEAVHPAVVAALGGSDGPTTWDDMPAPWDAPADETFAEDLRADDTVAWDAPAWDAPAEAWEEPTARAGSAVDASDLDVEPAEMFGFTDDLFAADAEHTDGGSNARDAGHAADSGDVENAAEDGDAAPMVEGSAEADPPPWAVSGATADLDDAMAPVLSDIEQPALPPWAGWSDESSAVAVVAPSDASAALGPTPPDDLFAAEPEPDSETQPAPTATADVSVAMPFSTTPLGQPVIVRIEVSIVDGSAVVRPIDVARPVAQSAAGTSAETEDSPTPRHPEFEPRNHLNGTSATLAAAVPAETAAPAPWLAPVEDEQVLMPRPVAEQSVWPASISAAAPAAPTAADADVVADVADPWASYDLPETDAEPDPLAALPAATLDAQASAGGQQGATPALFAATAAAQVAPATAATAQPDLWFLSSETETVGADDSPRAAREPSSAMTVGLTVLMALVVVGLVIAFLWLMTSLPILR